jgi:hypothetical protein
MLVAIARSARRSAGWSPGIARGWVQVPVELQAAGEGEVLVVGEDSPSFAAMAGHGPVVFDRLDAESAERIARRPGGREFTAGHASFLAMPLVARGAVVGCATFGRAPAGPPFGPADIAAAGELASRAAVCIDNARLYDRERRTAQALQRGLLPGRPQVPAGLEVAHRYLPVGDNIVGGDWYDIVPLPGRRAALIVGDAMGHGPEAAAVMVQLRTAAHTLAGLDLPAGQVLSRLDTMAAGLAASFAATCIYAVIDPPLLVRSPSQDQSTPEQTATVPEQRCTPAVLHFGTASDFLGLVLRARLSDVSDMDLADISVTDAGSRQAFSSLIASMLLCGRRPPARG